MAIGTVWADDTWDDDAWEAGTWADVLTVIAAQGTWWPYQPSPQRKTVVPCDVFVVGVEARFFVGQVEAFIEARMRRSVQYEIRSIGGTVRVVAQRQHAMDARCRVSAYAEMLSEAGSVEIRALKHPTEKELLALLESIEV